MPSRTAAIMAIVLVACAAPALAADRGRLSLAWEELVRIRLDLSLPHEGQPAGVPASLDWAQRPRMGAGHDPGGFIAVTGWGQVFQAKGSTAGTLSVDIRNMQVLVCHGPEREWLLLQQGVVEGSQFRPDYQDNVNKPARSARYRNGVTSVRFEKGAAYHFWPKQGRADLPGQHLCGVVVLLQAKSDSRAPLLLGLGGDYWKNKAAAWDHYQSNRDIAIGRMKSVDASWRWFGLTTAAVDDLRRLHRLGYHTKAPRRD
jgi:hypothetical protein